MKFGKTIVRFAAVLALALSLGLAQTPPQEEKKATGPSFSYNPGGRRDPFKDLLGGRDVKEKKTISGLSDLSIDDITLKGIVKTKGKLEAFISLTEGFPLTIHEGDKLADGFVLLIEETQVVFRRTRDSKGIPLTKPRDVIKEITFEER